MKVTTKLISLQNGGESCETIFLVDTGAMDSTAPANELEKIGVAKEDKLSRNTAVRESPQEYKCNEAIN